MQLVTQSLWCAVACWVMCCSDVGGATAPETGQTFFVSAASGDDRSDGLSPQAAWRTLTKVNAAPLRPGDRVLFKRGEVWRGQLIPQSGREGAPITYGAYGEGNKPLLLGSVSRNAPRDWQHEGGNVWATAKPVFTEQPPLSHFAAATWMVHCEGGAQVQSSALQADAPGALPGLRMECVRSGAASNHIQLYNRGLSVRDGDYFVFAFRVRCTKPFNLSRIALMKESAPCTTYGVTPTLELKVGVEWTEAAARFKATQTAEDGRITLYLGDRLPSGAVFDFQPLSWKRLRGSEAEELSVDVGNVIFDDGHSVGVKKWTAADLKRQGDYWYDAQNWQVKVYSERNPAELHKSIELALRRHIIDQGGKSHVVYEDLALRYGAAHGVGGGSTHHIVVRNCDLSYIGGGHQFTTADGRPVRFGNGIEFWSDAHDNLVEGCRIWEVYDAALTNQGDGVNVQRNITYRHNVIWNCEYSFEYWNRGEKSQTQNIRFEHNTCVNAGFGWGHTQRPDPNGRHLMFYFNSAQTSEFTVRHNIFCDATDSALRMQNDWTAGLTMERNVWYQPRGVLILFLKTSFASDQFGDYQKQTGLDAHSMVADPKFVNVGKLNFRLADDSPARRLSAEGGAVGSLRRLVE